jgi:hypothetical protein
MRFSNIFQLSTSQRTPAQAQHALNEPPPSEFRPSDVAPLVVAAAVEVPDDLDQRVRLIGEWQLGEAD